MPLTQRCTGILTALFAALFLAPAAHAFVICDAAVLADDDRHRQAFADTMVRQVMEYVPVRDLARARSLRVEFVDNPDAFGPYVDSDAPNTIRMPRGFTALVCNLVMVAAFQEEYATIGARVRACLRAGKSRIACLNAALAPLKADAERKFAALPTAGQSFYNGLPTTALDFLLMHEFAHIILKHLDETADDETVDYAALEFQADLYAARFVYLVANRVTGASLLFNMIEYLDEGRNTARPTHDSFACRRENLHNIAAIADTIVTDLMIFPSPQYTPERGFGPDTLSVRRDGLRTAVAGGHVMSLREHYSPSCRVQGLSQLDGVRRDLMQLARFQLSYADRFPAARDGSALAKLLGNLLMLRMETAEGRAVMMMMIAEYADAYRETRASGEVTAILMRVINSVEFHDARSFDMAKIGREIGQRNLYYPPNGRLNAEDLGLVSRGIGYGLEFQYDDVDTIVAAFRLALLTKNCALAGGALMLLSGGGYVDPGLRARLNLSLDPAISIADQLREEGIAKGCTF